tara:strand:+ start:1384 stop:2088 length:705 start_codon:yes stop_codon:yes gene_type:complete
LIEEIKNMKLYGKGLLMTFTEVSSELEADFNEWYNREHLMERVNIDGFRRARRYEAVKAEIKYLSTYEALDSDNIASPDYVKVLKTPSDWSKSIMPQFTKWHRMPCRVEADYTCGIGAALTLFRFYLDPTKKQELLDWINKGALEEMNKLSSIVGSCLVSVDIEADKRLANALGQTIDRNQNTEWAILVEGSNSNVTTETSSGYLSEKLKSLILSGTELIVEKYQFLYSNQRIC